MESHTGQVVNGVIVLDEGSSPLPEGAKVRIEQVDLKAALRDLSKSLRELAGTAEGLPEDFAENLDYYLHGHPKR